LDRVNKPDLGYFLEVKSRTWSRRDADHKAELAIELLDCLGISHEKTVKQDYLEIVETG
jgi:5-methylthioadenosine/S-adenosylhomocysteine deaminase